MTRTFRIAFDFTGTGCRPGAPAYWRPAAGAEVLCRVESPAGAGLGAGAGGGAAAEGGACGTTMDCWQDGQLICAPE